MVFFMGGSTLVVTVVVAIGVLDALKVISPFLAKITLDGAAMA